MIIGVDTEAVHRLDAGLGDGGDLRVVEASVGEVGGNSTHIGVGYVREDFGTVAPPPRQPVDVVAIQPLAYLPSGCRSAYG